MAARLFTSLKRLVFKCAWLLAGILSACASVESANSPAPASGTVSFELRNNHILVAAEINGEAGFTLLVDTGVSSLTLFQTPRTQALALKPMGQAKSIGTLGQDIVGVFDQVNVERVQIGAAMVENLQGKMIPAGRTYGGTDDSDNADGYIDGVIGYDLFKDNIIKIDFTNQTLSFMWRRALRNFAKDSRQSLRLPLYRNGKIPYVNIGVITDSGERVKTLALFDTGKTGHVGLYQRSSPVFAAIPPTGKTCTLTLSGRRLTDTARVNKIIVSNNISVANVKVDLLDGESGLPGPNGILGMGVIQHLGNIIEDYPREKLYLPLAPNRLVADPELGEDDTDLALQLCRGT